VRVIEAREKISQPVAAVTDQVAPAIHKSEITNH
jgi:hypothetical protein